MKRCLIPLLFLLPFLFGTANAQITVQIGQNSPYWIIGPFYSYYPDLFFGNLVLATDMFANGAPAGGGKIRAIAYYVPYTFGPNNDIPDMQWKMGHTANTATNVIIQSADKEIVKTDLDYLPMANQWNYIQFDQSFHWDGVQNLWIEACYDDPNNAYYTRKIGYSSASYPASTSHSQFQYGLVNGGNFCTYPAPGSIYYYPNYRPDIRLEICNGEVTQVSFSAPAAIYLPNLIPIDWSVGRSTGTFDATVTFNIYTPDGQFVQSQTFTVPIDGNTVTGTYHYNISNLTPGFYKLEMVVNAMDECNEMSDQVLKQSVMVLAPGSTPCEVWPGDVNQDGIVNYGDRKDLNLYIYEAAMSPVWLKGPARYRADVDVNPLTYLEWEAQYSVPWQTPDGCHMDSDGNGMVNNFDYIAIKMNWNRASGAVSPKQDVSGEVLAFDIAQNYPNPFNPSTTISYSVPERSDVRLQIFDMFGREVATLVSEAIDAGRHEVNFDAADLSSGQYLARVNMSGFETGFTFSKTIRMTLSK